MTNQIETITMSVVETVLNKLFKQVVNGITVFQENVKETPPSPDTSEEYTTFTVNYGAAVKFASQINSGKRSNVYQRVGVATAQIFIPQGVGTGRALEIAELIQAGFQDVEFAGRCLTITDITVLKVGNSGSFYQTNVDIAFQYFETQ